VHHAEAPVRSWAHDLSWHRHDLKQPIAKLRGVGRQVNRDKPHPVTLDRNGFIKMLVDRGMQEDKPGG
jgi:hypothetical protein